jgi:hypothetical protein
MKHIFTRFIFGRETGHSIYRINILGFGGGVSNSVVGKLSGWKRGKGKFVPVLNELSTTP